MLLCTFNYCSRLSKATVRRVTETELQDMNVQAKIADSDRTIVSSLVVQMVDDLADLPPLPDLEPAEPDNPYDSISERDELSDEAYDRYLNTELMLDRGGEVLNGTVKRRKRDIDGTLVGTSNGNPILDTREYLVELIDGSEETYSANTIVLNMYIQVDSEGKSYLLLNEITNHRREADAVCTSDGYVRSSNGNMVPRKTTKGWKLEVSWKSGETSWVPLKNLKESTPIEVVEYTVANDIDGEPAFKWWCKDVLRRRNRYVARVKSRYWKISHKFGIRFPHSVEEAFRIEWDTGTTHWKDTIKKEIYS